MLYHPHLGEIRPLIQRSIDKWPHLKSRCHAAEMILLNGDLRDRSTFTAPIDWQVKSQADDKPNAWYHIIPQAGHYTCGCYDHLSGKRNRAAGRIFCKHTIAWLAYKEILIKRLNHHLQAGTITVERVQWDYVLAGEHMGIVTVRRDEPYAWWLFAEDRSMAVFAHWLGRRQAQLQEPHDILAERKVVKRTWVYYDEEVKPRKADEQSGWSQEDWQHYFSTGETPAMVKVYELVNS